MPRLPGMRVPGRLEAPFNSSLSMHEMTSYLGKTLPVGRHPLDDWRQVC